MQFQLVQPYSSIIQRQWNPFLQCREACRNFYGLLYPKFIVKRIMVRSRSSTRSAAHGGMSFDGAAIVSLYDKIVHLMFMSASLLCLAYHFLYNPIHLCTKGGIFSWNFYAWMTSSYLNVDHYLTAVFNSLSSTHPWLDRSFALMFIIYAACEVSLIWAGLRGRSSVPMMKRMTDIKHVIFKALICASLVYLFPLSMLMSRAIYGLFFLAMLGHTWLSMDPAKFSMIHRYTAAELKCR